MISTPRLHRKLDDEDIDVIVAASPQNVFYLSGLQSLSQDLLNERAFALQTASTDDPHIILPAVDASIVVDSDLDYDQVYTYGSFYLYEGGSITDEDREVLDIIDDRNYDDPITALLSALTAVTDTESTVALEQSVLTPSEIKQLSSGHEYGELRSATPIFSDLRRVKSDEEVRRLRRSVEINEASIMAAIDELESGMTERELASLYKQELISRGAEPLFTVVGFGSHGAYPHAVPGDRSIETGDLVRFDVGCTYENYSSDIARTFAFEHIDETAKRKYEILNQSMDRSIDLLEDDVTTEAVFNGTIQFIRDEGSDVFDSFDRNHFGHGIGIDVYDPPTIDQSSNRIFEGMVMCVEPPYYELGTGGIQVEDEILITGQGAERFSKCPETLRVIE